MLLIAGTWLASRWGLVAVAAGVVLQGLLAQLALDLLGTRWTSLLRCLVPALWVAAAGARGAAMPPVAALALELAVWGAAAGAGTWLAPNFARPAFPRELLEEEEVDDGSDPPLSRPARTPLEVKVVRQELRGFGLARARNISVAAAAHDILVFLDGDVIPEAGLVSAHARWHQAINDALTLGFCACVSVAGIGAAAVRAHRGPLGDLFAGRPTDRP